MEALLRKRALHQLRQSAMAGQIKQVHQKRQNGGIVDAPESTFLSRSEYLAKNLTSSLIQSICGAVQMIVC